MNTLLPKLLLLIFTLTIDVYPKVLVYENADTNHNLKGLWSTNNGQPAKRIYSSYRGSGVMSIEPETLYQLKSINDIQNNVIKWDIKMSHFTYIYVHIKVKSIKNNKPIYTTRTILYYPRNSSIGLTEKGYIKIGIGNIVDNKWHTIRRDLVKDLHDYDPNSKLIAINEFWVKGKGELDNIETTQYRNFEDSKNTSNWNTFDDTSHSKIKLSYDKFYKKNVISLYGSSMKTGYALKPFYDYRHHNSIQWNMKYTENFTVYIKTLTKKGIRYVSYKNQNYNEKSKKDKRYFYIGLGNTVIDGKWHTITRNLNQDLKIFEPDNEIQSIISFMIRGSGYIDAISLLNSTYVEDDPIYSHKHYSMDVSGLSTELYSDTYDFYIKRVTERHHMEEGKEAIVLYKKRKDWKLWSNKVLIRGRKGIGLNSPNISKTPYNNKEIVLKYNELRKYNQITYSFPRLHIINLSNTNLSRELKLKGIPPTFLLYGNTLFTPTNKLLISVYNSDTVKIYRSLESYDSDTLEYNMVEIASFQKKDEIFREPVMSYTFDKLVVAIRKDIEWFNGRDKNVYEKYINTRGELYFTNDLEGGTKNTIWKKRVLGVETHGMYMPPYQKNHFLMLASNGENRQYVMTINTSNHLLNDFKYNKKAFYIKHRRGGGYPTAIRNEDEYLVLYWEETSDLRKTNIIIKDLYAE